MTLVQSWRDSLLLFKPKNFQLFVMVTIKSIIEAYKLYFKYFWWLLLIVPLLLFVAPDYVATYINRTGHGLIQYALLLSMIILLYGILFLAACFVTRPSILQKDCKYLRTQFIKITPYWLAWGLVWFFITIQTSFLTTITLVSAVTSYFSAYVFFVLFFADSQGGLNNFFISLWRACKMIIYNLPLLVVIGIILKLIIALVNYFFFIPILTKAVIGAFLIPAGVCMYANIYIKKLHDQFDLYFYTSQ